MFLHCLLYISLFLAAAVTTVIVLKKVLSPKE